MRNRKNPPWSLTLSKVVLVLIIGMAAMSCKTALARGAPFDEVVVNLQPGEDIFSLALDHGATIEGVVSGTDLYRLHVPRCRLNQSLAELNTDGRVAFAETDQALSGAETQGSHILFAFDSSGVPGQYLNSAVYSQIDLGTATSGSRGEGTVVAVLDTGVCFSHPDLQNHLLPGYNTFDARSLPDDVPDGVTNGGVGHGTMVAGLIARVAPNTAIMPIRVLNGDGVGTLFQLLAGLHYAIDHGANVVNLSLGASTPSALLADAIEAADDAGIIVAAAAGNESTSAKHYPAALHSVIAVASVEWNNVKSLYSNYGTYIRIVAPGTGIRSTYWTGGYATWSGTSFAVPFVSAEAALLIAANPNMKARAACARIWKTAHAVNRDNPAYRGLLGRGLIDIDAAVNGRMHDDADDE